MDPSLSNKTHCQFYIKRKQRYCKVPPLNSSRFCTEHYATAEEFDTLPNLRKRIPCPLDPKHSIYEADLKKHRFICNAAKKQLVPFYDHAINAPEKVVPNSKQSFRDLDDDAVRALILKCLSVYRTICGAIPNSSHLSHKSMAPDLARTDCGEPARKHFRQQASILGHMEQAGLLADGFLFIEFGAGKGGLSHVIQRALETSNASRFLLVDRSGSRYKMDNYHRDKNDGPPFDRIQIDIADLNLAKVDVIAKTSLPVVVVWKHLCGIACDLALRSLVNTLPVGRCATMADKVFPAIYQNSNQRNDTRLAGIVGAQCCHHRCEWSTLAQTSPTPLPDAAAFHLMTGLSGWATDGGRRGVGSGEEYDPASMLDLDDFEAELKQRRLTAQEREAIGRATKLLIDTTRTHYVRERLGLRCEIVEFIDRRVTLENRLMVARRL